ncbi:LysR family transcriptional regulator [Aminobacter sp. NyZ550]|uniref:LysR family transcriptional regulator n=1 Tax=Aminobacter sp. NyZ550 TaxID=2979870 RepID=UPI0021D5DB4C|nr:LysR family transcriptional regulator [Aminobacter sp. NyZ550]WAX96925.1 LysR family transcriptional regulator [Aminobacter sp. NyZ550]
MFNSSRSFKKSRNESKFARDVDWNLFKVFEEIVKAQGVTNAALTLNRQQPAISLALRRLEVELGVKLCHRGPRGFKMTDEGQLLAGTCAQMSEIVRSVPSQMAGTKTDIRGRVRVHLISNLVNDVLDQAIFSFNQKYPAVEIIIDVAPWADVVKSLLQDEIDIGLAPSRSPRAEIGYQYLFSEVHRPYCGRNHHFYESRIDDAALLADEKFILTGADEPVELTDFRLRYGLGRLSAGMSEHLEEAKRMTVLGVGLCFLPDGFARPDVEAGRLWPLLSQGDVPQMDIFVMTNAVAPARLARQLLVDELVQHAMRVAAEH